MANPSHNIDNVKERVRKLLARATDQAGTPEGDACFAKAFDIMARYGFEERDLNSADLGDELDHRIYDLYGAYTDMQGTLLTALCRGLHCEAVCDSTRRSTKIHCVHVFGLRRHLDRMDMLYTFLRPTMLTLANRHDAQFKRFGGSSVVRKRSFMRGFATTMAHRLREAEGNIHGDDGRYALALLDDASRAEQAMRDYYDHIGGTLKQQGRNYQTDAHSFLGGSAAAQNQDLGQERVSRNPALPA